jgi:hypothetical protein
MVSSSFGPTAGWVHEHPATQAKSAYEGRMNCESFTFPANRSSALWLPDPRRMNVDVGPRYPVE